MAIDVTSQVEFGNNDDEHLPLLKCVCGKKFPSWEAVISIYPDDPWQCDDCGRRLFFRNEIRVFEATINEG
jgi:DNA-directed RNA polymerase subunit RPC12/RpoP